MKKILSILTALMLFISPAMAQFWTIDVCSGTPASNLGSNVYGPMYSVSTANATNRTAVIYPASQLIGISGKSLSSAYFYKMSGNAMLGTPNFKIYLKEVSASDWGGSAIDWATSITGATLVYNGNPASIVGTTAGWKGFSFTAPFTYSGAQNLAVFFEYSNTTASNSITWAYEYSSSCVNTSNNNTTKYINNTTGTLGASLSSTNYRRPYIGFDYTGFCSAAPGSITASNVTTSSATLTWAASSPVPASGYEYYYNNTGVPPTSATTPSGSVGAGVTSVNLTGLSNSSAYTFWVRGNCGANKGEWGQATFTTSCIATPLPLNEGFNAATIPACWSKEIVAVQTASKISFVTSASNPTITPSEGTHFVSYNSYSSAGGTSGSEERLISKPLNSTGVSTVIVDFAWLLDNTSYTSSTYASEGMQVQYSVNGGTTWVDAGAFIPRFDGSNTTAQWVNKSVTLPAAAGNQASLLVAFKFHSAYGDNMGLDAVSIHAPLSCNPPSGVTTSNLTATGATVSWTAASPVPSNGYQYYVSTSTTTPGASVTPTGSTAAGVLTATLTGLTSNTTYNVWVRSNCGGAQSPWSSAISFTTSCGVYTVPFTENFDALTTLGTGIIPGCWSVSSNSSWTTRNAASTSYNDPQSAPNYITATFGASDEQLFTPGIQLTAGTTYRFKFSWVGDGYAGWDGTAMVGTSTSSGGTQLGAPFVSAATVTTNTYKTESRYFTPTTSGVYYFSVNINANYTPWYIGFDDFSVTVAPACLEPEAVTVTPTNVGGTLSWTAPTTVPSGGYQYYVSTSNVAPTASTTPTGTVASGTTATLTGLNANTTYYVWVRSNCGSSLSEWSNVSQFLTSCNPVSLPWTENFDALTTTGATIFPSCWKKENGEWQTGNAGTTSYNDPLSAPNYLMDYYSATNEYMWTPGFHLTAGTAYEFGFSFVGDGFTGWTGDVFANSAQNSTGATQLGASFISPDTASRNVYKQVWRAFTPTTTGTYYFAIRVNSTFSPWYIGFDNFSLNVRPACPSGTVNYSTGYCKTATGTVLPTVTGSVGTNAVYTSAPTGLVLDSATGAINPSQSAAGTYIVTYTGQGAGSCGAYIVRDTVVIANQPTATFSYPATAQCGNVAPFGPTFTGTVGGVFTASPGGLAINPANGVITPSTSAGGQFTVTYTIPAYAGCTQVVTTGTVTINNLSVAATSITASDTIVCSGSPTVTLTVAGGTLGTGATWKWYTGSCGGTAVGTGATLTTTIAGNTTFYVRAEGTCNTTACAQVNVVLDTKPDVTITASPTNVVTPAFNTVLTANVTPAGTYTYRWFRDGAEVLGQNNATITVTSGTVGSYSVIATSRRCSDTSNVIVVKKAPTNSLMIYPNPGNGRFSVAYYFSNPALQREKRSVVVVDAAGRTVFKQQYNTLSQLDVNISTAASGVYFVHLINENGNTIASGSYRKL